MMVTIRALLNGDYVEYAIAPGYASCQDLSEALHRLTRFQFEHDGNWDTLRVEDRNGRILARKDRWRPVEVREDGRWLPYESEAPDAS